MFGELSLIGACFIASAGSIAAIDLLVLWCGGGGMPIYDALRAWAMTDVVPLMMMLLAGLTCLGASAHWYCGAATLVLCLPVCAFISWRFWG